MRSFTCQCGGDLYFQSTHCLTCGAAVGMCPVCWTVSPSEGEDDSLRCGNPCCGAEIQPCRHHLDRTWCNRWVDRNERAPSTSATVSGAAPLCVDCRLTTHLPDLGNREHAAQVQRTEFAKQRTIYALRIIGLPIGGSNSPLPLTFRFLHDGKEPVATGHENGVITINLREADPVQREAARVRFSEPQRTLVGHFRHELGHYYWQLLVQDDPERLASFREVFGNELNPEYNSAMNAYYTGPFRSGWSDQFVSAYATMHPWEDFAETFNAYLDMRAVLDTANHFGIRSETLLKTKSSEAFDRMIFGYMVTGLVANELNRDLGLPDLVPEVFTETVRSKLRWIHELVGQHANPQRLPKSTPMPLTHAEAKV